MASQAVDYAALNKRPGWNVRPPPDGGGARGQARALSSSSSLADPAPITADTPVNPMQQTAFGDAKAYSDSLASGTNQMVTRELGRYRDDISTGMKSEGEAAMARGADPSFFKGRAMAAGQRGMADLQGRLADVSLGKQAEGIGLESNAANAGASEQRLMQLGTLSQRLNEQRALTEQAEVQARLNQAPYDRLLSMMGAVASDAGSYSMLGPEGYGGGIMGGGGGGAGGGAMGGGFGGGGGVPMGLGMAGRHF